MDDTRYDLPIVSAIAEGEKEPVHGRDIEEDTLLGSTKQKQLHAGTNDSLDSPFGRRKVFKVNA